MKTRGFAVVLAVILGALAAGSVYLYVSGVKDQNHAAAGTVEVMVSKTDIEPGTSLDPLLAQGQFELKPFPGNSIVEGAVTNVDQLRGRTTVSGILAGEQISIARLQGSARHTGGPLGIHDGFVAATIALDAPHANGGFIQAGDHVAIYAEGDLSVINGKLTNIFRKGTLQISGPELKTTKADIGDWAFTVVPDVRVLKVFNAGTSAAQTGAQGTQQQLQLTLELKPSDVQRVMLARESLNMWLALLPPGQPGNIEPAINSPLAPLGGTQ
jgi:pilus assembly protein CpaB